MKESERIRLEKYTVFERKVKEIAIYEVNERTFNAYSKLSEYEFIKREEI